MKNSKLFQVLSTLSVVELRAFRKFLQSPLHNQRKDVLNLFNQLIPYINKKEGIEKSVLQQQLFPKQVLEIEKFDLLISYLYRLLQDFLAWKEWQADKIEVGLAFTQSIKKRGLTNLAQTNLSKLQNNLQKQPYRSTHYLQQLQAIQWQMHQVADTNQPEKNAQKWAMSTTLDQWYFVEKLKHYCLLLAYQQVYPSQVQLPQIAHILQQVEKTDQVQFSVISVYFSCIKMLKNPSEIIHFQVFKNSLITQQDKFPTSEFRTLLLMGINYCIKKVNDGIPDFLTDLLALYKSGIQTDSLLENGQLSRFTYHNIVGTGVNNEDWEWTANFITHYKNKLNKQYRESSYSFSLARLAYHQDNQDKALTLLQKSNYRDVLLNLAAKTLLLKIYYEKKEDTLLYAHLEAMQRYLYRKRVIGYHKKNYLNIIRYTKKLLNLNFFDKKAIYEFQQALEQEDALTEKSWFLKQVK